MPVFFVDLEFSKWYTSIKDRVEMINMSKPSTADEIYLDLLNRIINLELEPGQKISENTVCELYGVSRSVIRNSFARLMQAGFLEVYPQRGTYVSKIDLDYVRTALLIRIAIEKEMLYRFMAQEDKSETIKKMEENFREQEKFYYANDYINEFKQLDEKFHELIMLSVENKNILESLNEQLLHISRWRNVYIRSGYKVSHLVDEHKEILEAIKENNVAKAMSSMSKHIDTINAVIEFNPEFLHYMKND